MSEIKIQIKNLYKIFGKSPKSALEQVKDGVNKDELLEKHNHVLGLKDINLDIKEKSIQVVMGLSGSGKSTLIRHINRLIEPTDGSVVVDGEDVLKMNDENLRNFRRTKTAMVFQRFALLPHKTVLENTMFGLHIQNIDEKEANTRARRWIDRVGLSGYEEKYPQHLSGGMQQRVGLARALTNDGEILLMDEAFSALDPLIRSDMQQQLIELQSELKKTIVFITHDLDESLRLGDHIGILNGGRLVQVGTPEQIIMNPADDYVEAFVKDVNRAKVLRAKTVMIKADQFNAKDLKLSDTYKVNESVYIEEFLPKVLSDRSTIVVVDNKGDTMGYITEKELAISLSKTAHQK